WHLYIEGHTGGGNIKSGIALLPSSSQFVAQVVANQPVPRKGQEWRVRVLEAKRNRRVTAGSGRDRQTLLTINVVAQVVFLLVGKDAFDAVTVVDSPVIAGGERFAIGVDRASCRERV